MKTTKLFLLIICLLLVNSLRAQTVTMSALTVNGQSVSPTGPINLGTNSTDVQVGLSVQVQMPNSPSDSNPGTIIIYYKKNSSNPINLAIGGNGGNLLFFGGLFGYRNFMITLQSTQFDANGGIIYAEYETSSNIKYQSTNLSVIKSSNSGTSGNPPSTPSPYTEFIPYGADPILAKVPAPSSTSTFEWVKSNNTYVNANDANNVYTYIENGYSTPLVNSTILYLKQKFNDGTYSIDLSTKFYVNVSMPYRQDLTNPFIYYRDIIVNNKIGRDQYIPYGTTAQTILGESGSIRQGRTGPVIQATNYQWQKRIARPKPEYYNYLTYISLYGWQDIPSATQLNYSPGTVTEVTEYRRLIVQPGNYSPRQSATSNIHTIYPMSTFGSDGLSSKNLNTICCNQTRIITGNYVITLDPIVGSNFDQNSFIYLWQKEVLERGGVNYYWQNIPFSNTKDYTPFGEPRDIGRKYRRIVVSKSDYKHYFSNEITISFPSSRINLLSDIDENYISIYPNPTSSIINIQSSQNLATSKIKIIDLTGRIMFTEEATSENENSLEIDISSLPVGLYNLVLENSGKLISKKIIKN